MTPDFGNFDLAPNSVSPASILSGVSMEDLQGLMEENSSLRGYIQGYLAELVLKRKLLQVDGVSSVSKIPDRDEMKGDLLVDYRGRPLTIEVKSIATNSVKPDVMNETWQGSVLVKNTDKRILNLEGIGEVSSTNLIKGEFDILAICCFAVRGSWDFLFLESRHLPEPAALPGFVQTKFSINPSMTAGLTHDPIKVMEAVYRWK